MSLHAFLLCVATHLTLLPSASRVRATIEQPVESEVQTLHSGLQRVDYVAKVSHQEHQHAMHLLAASLTGGPHAAALVHGHGEQELDAPGGGMVTLLSHSLIFLNIILFVSIAGCICYLVGTTSHGEGDAFESKLQAKAPKTMSGKGMQQANPVDVDADTFRSASIPIIKINEDNDEGPVVRKLTSLSVCNQMKWADNSEKKADDGTSMVKKKSSLAPRQAMPQKFQRLQREQDRYRSSSPAAGRSAGASVTARSPSPNRADARRSMDGRPPAGDGRRPTGGGRPKQDAEAAKKDADAKSARGSWFGNIDDSDDDL